MGIKYKKLLASLVLVGLISGLFLPINLSPSPKKSEAQAVTGPGFTLNVELNPEYTFLPDAWIRMFVEILKRWMINQLTNMIVGWIQGGGPGGKPLAVTNWKGFLQGAFDLGFDQIVRQLGAGFLCQPFNLQVQLAFQPLVTSVGGIPNIRPVAQCTLDKIVKNVDSFFNGDFRQGGFVAYNQAWLGLDNYYGKILVAHDLALANAAAKRGAAEKEALAGKGTLSQRGDVCVEEATYVDIETGEESVECEEYAATTPGAIVSDAVAKAVTIDLDGVVNSRDVDAFIAAVTAALINKVLTKGVLGASPQPVGPKPTPGKESAPSVTIKANGQKGAIVLNNAPVTYTISWEAKNAASCEASGDWSGTKKTSGSETFSNINAGSYTYTITCGSTTGGLAEASVKVDVYD